jgi:hypothetical protein
MLQDLRTFSPMYCFSASQGRWLHAQSTTLIKLVRICGEVPWRSGQRSGFVWLESHNYLVGKVLLKSGSASLGVSAFLWMTCPSSQLYTPVNEVAWPAANTLALQPDERRRFQVLGRWHRVRNNLAFLHSSPKRSLCTTIRSSNCLYFLLLVDWRSKDRGPHPAFGFPHG